MNNKFIYIFLLTFISAYFIMFFPQIGTYAYDRIFQSEETYAPNTSIGTVSVAGLSREEAETKVLDAVNKWKTSQAYNVTFADQSVEVPLENFSFPVSEVVSTAQNGAENTLYVNMDEKYVTSILLDLVGNEFINNINQQAVKAELEKQAGSFATSQSISITQFLRGEAANRQVLSSANMMIAEPNSLKKWVDEHPTLTIPAKSNFSFIGDVVGKKTAFSNDFLSKVASVLYEASLATNLEIVERSISTELPEGYKLGYEARVNLKDLDLTLYNPNDYEITVAFRVENGNTLVADMNGFATGKSYKVVERNRITYPYKQIIHYTTNPASEQSKPGKEGYSIMIYRNSYDSAGINLDSVLIAKDFYLPVNEVVVKKKV